MKGRRPTAVVVECSTQASSDIIPVQHEHCWHYVGEMKSALNVRSSDVKVCCYCSKMKFVVAYTKLSEEEHGPYVEVSKDSQGSGPYFNESFQRDDERFLPRIDPDPFNKRMADMPVAEWLR